MSDTVWQERRIVASTPASARTVTTSFEAVDGTGRRYVIFVETTALAPFATSTRYYTQDGYHAWSIDESIFELFEPAALASESSVRVTRLRRGT